MREIDRDATRLTRRRLLGMMGVGAGALLAACTPAATAPTAAPAAPVAAQTTAVPAPTIQPTPAPTATPAAKFPAGLYVMRPRADGPGGELELVGGTLAQKILVRSIAFDVSPDAVVWGENDTLVVARADGTMQRIAVKGLYAVGRPSLSPDSQRVVVQATEDVFVPRGTPPPVGAIQHLDTVYIVDLRTGTWRRVGAVPDPNNVATQSEMPVFFPSGDRVAYWVPEQGCLVIKVHDAATLAEVLTIRDRGTTGCYQPKRGFLDGARFHFAVSRDSSRIVSSGQLQVYDAKTGAVVADVHQAALDGLAAAGYRRDTRFRGTQMAGTFPIAASFSPDGTQLVFDGGVEKDGVYGVILCRINIDGSGFTVVRAPVPVPMPQFTNNLNFSPLWPQWR